jgi:rare lipoprotein A
MTRSALTQRVIAGLRRARTQRVVAGLLIVAAASGCAGSATSQDRSAEDERSRALVRAGTAPTRPLPREQPPQPLPLSDSDAALVRAGTLPVAGTSASPTPPENPLDAQYRDAAPVRVLSGRASYYHDGLAGRSTATGEPYDPRAYTCASRTLPFGTLVRVVRRDDESRRVVVRVNDRGPFGDASRLVDLSRAAAEALGTAQRGVADVRVEILVLGDGPWGHGRVRRRHHRQRRSSRR